MLQYELDRVTFLRKTTVVLSERLGLTALQSIVVRFLLFIISYYIMYKLQHV
jgi:hypothetical protein